MSRQFNVFVIRPKKTALKYPAFEGEKALRLMQTMKERGFETVAETTANSITEQLNLTEMIELFA